MTAAQRRRRKARARNGSRPKLIGYTRVSSQEQVEHVSLSDQAERIEAHCKANACELLRIEADRGVSGFKKPRERPAMRRALKAVESGEADGIVAIALDRLSRNAVASMELIEESEKAGWRLIALDLALDTGTASGKMVATVMAAVGEMYRNQISERTSSALAKLVREGRATSPRAPFGFRMQGGGERAVKGERNTLVKHTAEQKILRRMLALHRRGVGPTDIARRLNEDGQLTRSGTEWARQTIWRTIERLLDRQETLKQ